MRLWLFLLALPLAGADRFPLADGYAEFEFLTASTFKFTRVWEPNPKTIPRSAEFKSDHLVVHLSDKAQLSVTVASTGQLLWEEAAPARRSNGEVVLDRVSPAGEEFFGLGPRADARLGLRGRTVDSGLPFLISTKGYAIDYKSYGRYRFDLAKTNKLRSRTHVGQANRIEYLFHYGPTPKEIYEERFSLQRPIEYQPSDLDVLSSRSVPSYAKKIERQPGACALVNALTHSALSGITVPAVNLDHYPELEVLASIIPVVYRSTPLANPPWRERLRYILITYLQEVQDRGLPMIHALPYQYPTDAEAWARADEFLLGDELLVAPLCDGNQRTVYFPRGTWTDLRNGITHKGRQTITVTGDPSTPLLFARNGSIIPLAEGDRIDLHYLPKLGAEFFIWEPDVKDISQVHAGPSADFLRLEIESKKNRTYGWVVYLGDGRMLRQTVQAKAGGDEILNLPLPWN